MRAARIGLRWALALLSFPLLVNSAFASGPTSPESTSVGRPAPDAPDPSMPRELAVRSVVDSFVRPFGDRPLVPPGTSVDSVDVVRDQLVVRMTFPPGWLGSGKVTDDWLDALSWELVGAFDGFPELRGFHVLARDPFGGSGAYRPLPAYLPPVDREALRKESEGGEAASAGPLVRRVREGRTGGVDPDSHGTATGALDGKQIFFSQCHGWLDYSGGWSTQRGVTNGIVEDFVNPEAVNAYLVRYLENAGADLFTLRETDSNPALVVVDSRDGTSFPSNGTYVETGSAALFSNSPNTSFGNFRDPYSPTDDPLRVAGDNDRLIATAPTETARATFTPNIPAEGDYDVYVTYTRNGSARASDAHYVVSHTGGATHFRVNQERHGWVWVRLGRFHFAAGSNGATGSVALLNDSAEASNTVSADAVRFGGGMGDVLGENHVSLSGRPRWEEGARSYIQYCGASSSVWGSGDVGGRSKFAAWENYAGLEDSVYVSWHSNAASGTARGTTSYIYSDNPPDGTYSSTQAVPGSSALNAKIHDEMVNDIRAAWDPAWQNRGYKSAYFGEINPGNNSEMPSCLLEVAFHDNASDADALEEPRFRRILARSVYQGIVKYFAARDAIPVRLLPEPPEAPEVHSLSATSIRVSWVASPTDGGGLFGDAATSYLVHRSTDGKGFDDGTATTGTSLDLTGLAPGSLLFVRVTAVNAGGESFPTETLAVRLPDQVDRKILIVNGFDRLDGSQLVSQYDAGVGTSKRMFLDRMNSFDYAVRHAQAMAAENVAVDSASNEAVSSGRVALSGYSAVDWICGEESTADETFSTSEQALVTAYLAGGGSLFATGAEIGWDLDALGSSGDRSFWETTLGADYVSDDAGTYTSVGVSGSILAGVTNVAFDDGTYGTYDANYPDVLGPSAGSGSTACLFYGAGSAIAGLQRTNGASREVIFGFPFETIRDATKRSDVMSRVLDFLVPCTAPTQAVTIPAARKNGGAVDLTISDPNPAANVTAWSVWRSSSPSLAKGSWTAVAANAPDSDPGTAGVQWSDASGSVSPSGLWCYDAAATNHRCPADGPR